MTSNFTANMFKHPGTMMSPDMTFRLKDDIPRDPLRLKAFEKMTKEVPLDYTPKALKIVDIGFGGGGQGHKECTSDGEVAYKAALLYWATMKNEYAMKAINIIKAWASENIIFKGDNAPLEAAWSVCSLARAAELVKYAKSPEIVKAWNNVENVFFSWLDRIIMPLLKKDDVWRWKVKNNWHFSMLCARAQIAILRNDVKEWQWAIDKYKELLPFAICQGHECHTSETTRDCTHAQFLLGGIIQFPEMAYHQGVNLFDAKLSKIFEYQAAIMLQEVPEGICKADIHTPYGFWYEPVWEVALAHFKGRCKMSMPKTEKWLATFRPERVCFHWGGGTLTHYNRTK